MSATVITTIDIDAGPQAVWDVLTDFPAYPEWNPFMDRIDGTAEVATGWSSTWPAGVVAARPSGPGFSWPPRGRSCAGSAGWAWGVCSTGCTPSS
ncbi:MAG: SRPBCC family protein [Kineosporiaceae bacterium]